MPDDVLKGYLLNLPHAQKEEVGKCFPINEHKVKLGKYFQGKITYQNKPRILEASGGGGTLSYTYKKGLADYVYEQIMDKKIVWSDLEKSKDLELLIIKLYSFIKVKNKK